MYSNFNVKEFENLRDRSEKVFTSIIDNLKAIRTECSNMSNIVMSDDSNLGMRWQSLYDSMEGPITNVEDTFVVVRALLDAYVENTIANEKAAQKELEELDNDMNTLAGKAETLLTGLTALRGVGFGATAVAIPALGSEKFISAPGTPGQVVTKYAPPEAVTKYAPPTVIDDPIAVTKYAPPDAVTLYAPPSVEPPVVTKYAPPDAVTLYAPPSVEPPVVVKYAPPEVVPAYAPPSIDPPVIVKYAPPEVVPAYAPPEIPIVKYAPPSPGPDTPPSIPGVPYWMKPIDKK